LDGAGDFRRFTIDVMKPKTLVASFHSELNEFVNNLDDSLIHGSTRKIEEESASNATLPRAATTTLGSDSFQSEDLRSRSRLGLRNSATELQEVNKSESLSVLEKNLDYLLQIGKPEATARRGAAGCIGDSWRAPWDRSSRSLDEFEGPLHQHQSTQGGGLLLRTYASADRFIEFEIGFFSERLHRPRLLGSTSPRAATSMHRGRRPRRPGSTLACAGISARSSDEFDYFDFARRLGGSSAITSTSRGRSATR
jgi:hypothetical protein